MELISTILSVLFVMNASTLIILFVGWLTHADYYYKIHSFLTDVGLFVHCMLTSMITFIGLVGLLVNDTTKDLYGAMIFANGLYFVAWLVFVIMIIVANYITNLHNYFGKKRGR